MLSWLKTALVVMAFLLVLGWAITMTILYVLHPNSNSTYATLPMVANVPPNQIALQSSSDPPPYPTMLFELTHLPIENIDMNLPKDYISYILGHELMHRRVVVQLLPHLDPRGLMIDVGCFCGDMAMVWAKMGRNVLAIDPSPQHMALLRQAISENNLTTLDVRQCGVGDKEATLRYQGPKEHLSVLLNDRDPISNDTIQIYPLDQIVNGKFICFMHIDVEEFEYETLVGAEQTIRTCRPIMTVETHIVTSAVPSQKAVQWLLDHSYRLFLIPECCGVRRDCRNLLAIPQERDVSNMRIFGERDGGPNVLNEEVKSVQMLREIVQQQP